MLNFNLVGDSFTHKHSGHSGYSTYGKVPKYIDWKYDISLDTFYIEENMNLNLFNSNVNNYGWILEPKGIKPELFDHIKNNVEIYLKKFKYIFTNDSELLDYSNQFKFCPASGTWIKDKQLHKKTKLISMIASNKNTTEGHKTRLYWANKLKNHLDLYGRISKETTIESKEVALNDYMFSVVVENGFFDTYFSEKILDCFVTGTIPIYWGTNSISKYFDERGIIFLDDSFNINDITRELYQSKLEYVKTNFDVAVREEYETLEDYIYLNYLKK
jgi:hypothetical protein